jgi:uncharacterized protein YndB with AHSA1/START domain
MPDIFHNFPIKSSPAKVFENISAAEGLDNWWTKSSVVKPEKGGEYLLDFGPMYRWKAVVRKYQANQIFELQFTEADADWIGTKVGFLLKAKNGSTDVNFYHTGWPQANEHFKISSYCWAMYLRILKRYTEKAERVPYEKRLNV